MDDLESLELLSLVSKVTSELQNHLGISDKTLAEFIIAQHSQCGSLEEFQQKLDAMGADFPKSLVESVDHLVLTMHPKFKGASGKDDSKAENGTRRRDEKTKVFKGLALPDTEMAWENGAAEYTNGNSRAEADAIDDTLALLEGLEGRAIQEKPGRTSRKRSRSPEDNHDYDRGRIRKERYRSRSRSADDTRRRRRHGFDEDDDFDRSKYGHKSSRRRKDPDDQFRRPPTPEIDDEPILYKVYDGHVTGVKDFGAFVNIHRVKGKVDGLVHVSALVEGQRVNHPSDLVSRGQSVKVKVIKMEGTRIGLSMKDVDQETGRDLVPHARIQSGANIERLRGGKDQYSLIEDKNLAFNTDQPRKAKKRMTSPERWEIRQLIASGVV